MAKGGRDRLLTLASGGWVILAAVLLSLAATAWRVLPVLMHPGSRAIGDGLHPESYGFPLEPALVPLDTLTGAGIPRDGLPVLDEPDVMTAAEADALDREVRGHYLVGEDRVIGVAIGGEARAYPIRVLNWHEVVNDTLGGVPILVSYGPLCDSAVVLDRRASGETLRFGVSGLLLQSCPLVYDRREAGAEPSLWAPLLSRAVTGPAAERDLRLGLLPSSVTTWADWRTLHPATTVLRPDRIKLKRYRRSPYSSYRGSDLLRAPVSPLPDDRTWPLKTPLLVLFGKEGPVPLPLPALAERAGENGEVTVDEGGVRVALRVSRRPLTARIETSAGEPPPSLQCDWFAWYALHPRTRLTAPPARSRSEAGAGHRPPPPIADKGRRSGPASSEPGYGQPIAW